MSLGLYINGRWQKGSGPAFHSINPANGKKIWEGTEASATDIHLAYEKASHAQKKWEQLGFSKRAELILKFSNLVASRKDKIAKMISLESGKPFWESLTEVNAVIGKVKLSIEAYEARCPEIHTPHPDNTLSLRFKPLGIVGVLGPFNFPAHLSNGHIVPALLAGNCVIYKPSELTPGVAEIIMGCWHDSNLPPGTIQCIQGPGHCAQELLNHDLQGVFFTGSYQTGVHINQQFSQRPEVLLALEMGGNNPLVIGEIESISAAVYQTILSSFITAGQRCTCARRLIVPKSSKGDEYLSAFVKASRSFKIGVFTQNPEPFMGPVIRYEQALSHLKKQRELIDSGGKPLLSMDSLEKNTGFLSPGIIDMTDVVQPKDQEIFAPLVQVYRYDDFTHALTLANQTQFGLIAGLLSENQEQYHQFYPTIKAGLINWNRPTTGASSALPFGGIGHSGNHRPSAYFAADYCAYPVASMENSLIKPETMLPGVMMDED